MGRGRKRHCGKSRSTAPPRRRERAPSPLLAACLALGAGSRGCLNAILLIGGQAYCLQLLRSPRKVAGAPRHAARRPRLASVGVYGRRGVCGGGAWGQGCRQLRKPTCAAPLRGIHGLGHSISCNWDPRTSCAVRALRAAEVAFRMRARGVLLCRRRPCTLRVACSMTWLDRWWRRVCPPHPAAAVPSAEWWRRPLLRASAWAAPSARFPDPQEGEWHRKFTGDQAGLDVAVSLQTLLFPSLVARLVSARPSPHPAHGWPNGFTVCTFAGGAPSCPQAAPSPPPPPPWLWSVFTHCSRHTASPTRCCAPPAPPAQLWDQARSEDPGGGLSAVDALWLAGFLAWAPLLLWLSLRRPKAYLRLRTPLVLLSRLHRSLTCECRVPHSCAGALQQWTAVEGNAGHATNAGLSGTAAGHACCSGSTCLPQAALRARPCPPGSLLHGPPPYLSAVVRWAGLFSREAMGAGGPGGAVSRQAQLGLLLWRVRVLSTAAASVMFSCVRR